jgi:hypothetical protein
MRAITAADSGVHRKLSYVHVLPGMQEEASATIESLIWADRAQLLAIG